MLSQGSPTPGPRTGTGLWPVRSQATQQEVSGGQMSKASSVFTAAPHCLHYCLSSASCQHYGELCNYSIIYYNVIIEIKGTINVMHLNHPKTIPLTTVCGKTVFHETGLWCQKGCDHCAKWNKSDIERQIPHNLTYVWNLRNKTITTINKKDSRQHEAEFNCNYVKGN